MTELVFKGKEFVWNYHLAVPSPARAGADEDVDHETMSCHLPVDPIEHVGELAGAYLKIAREEKRKAKRKCEQGPEARKSAPVIVQEAFRPPVEAEINMLKGCEGSAWPVSAAHAPDIKII